MGVQERKARERQEMKTMILQAAHTLFLKRGFESVSIRSIADVIEYSPAIIYRYFRDKNEIFYALQGEAFKAFNTYTLEVEAVVDPFERLIALARKYLEFSVRFDRYYTIMFIAESPSFNENATDWKEGSHTYGQLTRTIEACKASGRFQQVDTRVLSFSIWSYMHGMCSLALRNRMRIYPKRDRLEIRDRCFEQFTHFLHKL